MRTNSVFCIKLSYLFTYTVISMIFFMLFNTNDTGAQLKYFVIPLGILLFAVVEKFELKFISNGIITFCLMLSMIFSTLNSDMVSWEAKSRSFVIILLFYIAVSMQDYSADKVKLIFKYYEIMVLFCTCWVLITALLSGQSGFDRYYFIFITGEKDVNYFASFMLPSVAFLIFKAFNYKLNKKYNVTWAILTSVAVFFTGSRASFIALVVAMGFAFLHFVFAKKISYKMIVIYVLTLIVAVVAYFLLLKLPIMQRLLDPESYSSNVRLVIWGYAIEVFKDNIWFGNGLGATCQWTIQNIKLNSHNNYIDILGDQGLVGMAIFLVMLYNIFKVKKCNILFMFVIGSAALIPLAFINGYQTFSFWGLIIVLQILSNYLKQGSFLDLLER